VFKNKNEKWGGSILIIACNGRLTRCKRLSSKPFGLLFASSKALIAGKGKMK
jgi:hypothetical protein